MEAKKSADATDASVVVPYANLALAALGHPCLGLEWAQLDFDWELIVKICDWYSQVLSADTARRFGACGGHLPWLSDAAPLPCSRWSWA